MIPKDQARARNDLNTASRKLVALFRAEGWPVTADDLERTTAEALETFDAIKEKREEQSA